MLKGEKLNNIKFNTKKKNPVLTKKYTINGFRANTTLTTCDINLYSIHNTPNYHY